MGAADTPEKNPNTGTSRKYKSRYPKILYFTALVGFVMVAWILVYEKVIVDKNEQPTAEKSETTLVDPNQYRMLLGRWQRPDGGYIIEINRVKPDGTLGAAYYNPNPIHVSQALVGGENPDVQIFIELTDVNYPGATYSLTYDRQNNILKGVYYQPAMQQRYDVFFIKMN